MGIGGAILRLGWRHVFADGGYAENKLKTALQGHGSWTLEIIKRSDTTRGFEFLPRRWVVENTLHGSAGGAASPKTGRDPSKALPHGPLSPASECSPAESQGTQVIEEFLNQALRV
jgi:transposase|tara:strand:+ start:2939 stop:3286 length:348 start_codon:yes stop_codon:yes gene_type:complete